MYRWFVYLACALMLGSAGWCGGYDEAQREAGALSKAGQKLAAADVLENAIGADEGDEAQYLRGTILTLRGAPDKDIVAQYLKVVDNYPASPRAALALVRVGHLRDRMGEDSGPDWQRIVSDYPHTEAAAIALHSLGHCALRKNDPELAIKMFTQAADAPEANPGDAADSRVEAGYACISQYWKTKNKSALTDARDIFQKLITSPVMPARARAYLALGEIDLINGAGESAAHDYRSALATKPDDPYLLGIAEFGLGCALYTGGDYVGSEAALTEFLNGRIGKTLVEKDRSWQQVRSGGSDSPVADPTKAPGLKCLDLVPTAAYWKAACLAEMKRYADAKSITDELKVFSGRGIAPRVANLEKICAHALGEDK